MIFHWRAIRLLPDLVDGALDPDLELDVEVHMASCARCRRRYRELELSESLLRELPISLAPLDFDAGSYARLASLSRWSEEGLPKPRSDRYAPPMLALASVAMLWLLAATVSDWGPVIGGPLGEPMQLAQLPPEIAYLAHVNTGRF